MSEGLSSTEGKEAVFNRSDLTSFEHLIIGSSAVVNIGGGRLEINSSYLEKPVIDEEVRRILFTPISVLEGRKDLKKVTEAREKGEVISEGLSFFELKSLMTFLMRGIDPAFKPGQLDENGQLTTFETFLLQNDQQVELPKNPTETLVVNKNFSRFVEYLGQEDGKMKFRVRGKIEEKE